MAKQIIDFEYKEYELQSTRFRLPIGIYVGDRCYRNFTLKEITGRHELIMGRIEADYYDPNIPSTLSQYTRRLLKKILFTAIDEIEDLDFQDFLKETKLTAETLLNKLYLADVLALFINFRVAAYGQNIVIGGICPCSRREKIRPSEEDAHDLNTIILRCYEGKSEPLYTFTYQTNQGTEDSITLSPPRFEHLNNLVGEEVEEEPVFFRILRSCYFGNRNIEDIYMEMDRPNRQLLKRVITMINIFGPDKKIAMDCPHCSYQWDSPLLNGYNYESFYLTLLTIPRTKKIYAGENPAQILLDKIAFFLSTGEQAPFSSAESVYDLTIPSRQFWVDELSKTYEKQREEMQKSQSKSKKSGYRRNR